MIFFTYIKKKKERKKACLGSVSFEIVDPAPRNALFVIWMFMLSEIPGPVRQR